MESKRWHKLVRSGESIQVEFKQQIPKLDRLARSFSAFSNSAGGTVFIGVRDDGSLMGVESVEGTRELVEQVAAFNCQPAIQPECKVWEPMRNVRILVVDIPESEDKPVYAIDPNNPKDAWPFFRSDKENLPLDRKSLKTMCKSTSTEVEVNIKDLDRHAELMLTKLHESPRQTCAQLAKACNIGTHRAKKILVRLEQNGWVHSFFNEKRREYSLAIPWPKR